jgi:hypothetical protein
LQKSSTGLSKLLAHQSDWFCSIRHYSIFAGPGSKKKPTSWMQINGFMFCHCVASHWSFSFGFKALI